MTIKIYNENRLTGQPFFKDLIEYLAQHNEVMLRQIHKDFADVKILTGKLTHLLLLG